MKSIALFLLASVSLAAAQVSVLDPSAAAIVSADAAVTKLGGDMKFVEGPVWVEAEKRLLFSDIPAAQLMHT